MLEPESGHEAVLPLEVLSALSPAPGHTFIDCTIGRAGHALLLAEKLAPDGLLIGLDADERNLAFAHERLSTAPCRIRLFHANFAELNLVLRQVNQPRVDGILADLGLSTNQLFDERYGLSFDRPMPLDMRIDTRYPTTAAILVNTLRENDLANVLYELAQERYSRRIARKIVEARALQPILTTERLAELVRSAIPRAFGNAHSIDPATRTFLALRMAVNRESQNLESLLRDAPMALSKEGRLAIISFQSTEDRAVKQAFRSLEQTGLVNVLTKKPVIPTDSETARNPRSRSAKLRVIEKR